MNLLTNLIETLNHTIQSDLSSFSIESFLFFMFIFWVARYISSLFEAEFFRFVIFVVGLYKLDSLMYTYESSILFNKDLYIGFGLLSPHIHYYKYVFLEKYYQMHYATINFYYFSITVYYKLIRLAKASVWFVMTLIHLIIWIVYLTKNCITLFVLAIKALYEILSKQAKHTKRNILKQYWQWFKYDWQFQQEQRGYAKDEYQAWYKGTRFFYQNPTKAKNYESSKSYSNHSKSNKQKQNENEDWQQRYEDWFKKNKSNEYSEQQYQKKQEQNHYQHNSKNENKQESSNKKSYDVKYTHFFEGDYYTVLGVKYGATFEEVKQAWKKLVNIYHPDRNPDNAELFTAITQKLNEAYGYFKERKKKEDEAKA